MKITRAMRYRMIAVGAQLTMGQFSTMEALAIGLRAILEEVEQQLHANQN